MIERYVELLKMPFWKMTHADLEEQRAIEAMLGEDETSFINTCWHRGFTNEQIVERYHMYRSLLDADRLRNGGEVSRTGLGSAIHSALIGGR